MIPVANADVKRHSALAMWCIGGDHAKLKTFSGVMDLPNTVATSSFSKLNATLESTAAKVQAESMKSAGQIDHSLAGKMVKDQSHLLR